MTTNVELQHALVKDRIESLWAEGRPRAVVATGHGAPVRERSGRRLGLWLIRLGERLAGPRLGQPLPPVQPAVR